jgi:hypothetical protein
MRNLFTMTVSSIQPSQLYISAEKLKEVMQKHPLELKPIPVKKLDGKIIFTDGHTRALAHFLHDIKEIKVYWDEDDLDWQAYKICVSWCEKENILTIADLKNRIIPSEEYEIKWLKRCKEIQFKLRCNKILDS